MKPSKYHARNFALCSKICPKISTLCLIMQIFCRAGHSPELQRGV